LKSDSRIVLEVIKKEWCQLPPSYKEFNFNSLINPPKPSKNLATNKKPLTKNIVSG